MSMTLKTMATYVDNDRVRKLFEKYDLNKNGVMEKEEFIQVMIDILKELGEDLPEKKHREVAEEGLLRFDLNNNGKIEFNELDNSSEKNETFNKINFDNRNKKIYKEEELFLNKFNISENSKNNEDNQINKNINNKINFIIK
jgi:Ca2+-binding EF-hand superfamily protein